MAVRVSWADIEGLRRFDNGLKALGETTMRKVANRALNRVGDMGRTRVKRALSKQTGLTQKRVARHLKVKRSSWGDLAYVIRSRGSDIPLKYFKPKEVDGGTQAYPFRKKTFYPDAFFRGGRWPGGRVSLGGRMNGHVFVRKTKARNSLMLAKSGVAIPREMVKDLSAEAWTETVRDHLPRRVEHELSRATDNTFS
ncbi:hypothetical protein IWQ49_000041 [Labrenzia sp. EL_126]|nr:hypothetical protein [Labrenzia sp. EL_126]